MCKFIIDDGFIAVYPTILDDPNFVRLTLHDTENELFYTK